MNNCFSKIQLVGLFITFMVKIYYFYGEPDYYIYGKNFISFMVNNLLHLWLIFITFMVDYYIYGRSHGGSLWCQQSNSPHLSRLILTS